MPTKIEKLKNTLKVDGSNFNINKQHLIKLMDAIPDDVEDIAEAVVQADKNIISQIEVDTQDTYMPLNIFPIAVYSDGEGDTLFFDYYNYKVLYSDGTEAGDIEMAPDGRLSIKLVDLDITKLYYVPSSNTETLNLNWYDILNPQPQVLGTPQTVGPVQLLPPEVIGGTYHFSFINVSSTATAGLFILMFNGTKVVIPWVTGQPSNFICSAIYDDDGDSMAARGVLTRSANEIKIRFDIQFTNANAMTTQPYGVLMFIPFNS